MALGPGETFALPADASSFVGRGRELTELGALLRRTRMLTLSGTGGAGKTRLALELARGVQESFESGAVLVELGAVSDSRLVPEAVAAALDIRALAAQEIGDAVVDFLATRALLLVLDNCEHVLAETAALADRLLRSAPALTILATSREPLRVAGEVIFRVPSLDIPDPEQMLSPERLLQYESVSLFVERAVAAAPGFTFDETVAEDVARICLRLDGLPLALELAAGRLGALTPAAISERLDDRFRILRHGSHAAPTRQQTLVATLEWSHDLLQPDEVVLFRRLAVFAGGFALEPVEEVCSGGELDRDGVADALARLAEKSLVAVDESSSGRRYRLLETVRMYARERLSAAGEARAVADRHADWVLALAEAERGSLRLDPEAPNLRAGLRTLLDTRPHGALRLCVALLPFWLRRIDLAQAKRQFAAALEAVPDRTMLRVEALLAAAAIDFRSGTIQHGMALAESGHALALEIGDTEHEWRALQLLGEFGIASDNIDVALPWLEQALELARREGFAAPEAIGIHSLGVAQWILGDLPPPTVSSARASSSSAHARARRTRSRPRSASPRSERLSRRARSPCGTSSRTRSSPWSRSAAPPQRATRSQTRRGSRVCWAISSVRGRCSMRARRASRLPRTPRASRRSACAAPTWRSPRTSSARRACSSARRSSSVAGSATGAAAGSCSPGLGLVETAATNYVAAEAHLAEALDIFRRAGDRWGLASTLWRVADLALARGRLDEAETALNEALAVLGETQRQRWIASTFAGSCGGRHERGDPALAAERLEAARERYASRDDALGVAEVESRLLELDKSPLRRG